jgi:hypothetical protein
MWTEDTGDGTQNVQLQFSLVTQRNNGLEKRLLRGRCTLGQTSKQMDESVTSVINPWWKFCNVGLIADMFF